MKFQSIRTCSMRWIVSMVVPFVAVSSHPFPFHEPSRLRVADPRSGPRLCEAQRFMVPMRGRKAVETLHEPRGTSNIQRRTSNGRRESSITSTFEVRCLYLGSVASTDEFSFRRILSPRKGKSCFPSVHDSAFTGHVIRCLRAVASHVGAWQRGRGKANHPEDLCLR